VIFSVALRIRFEKLEYDVRNGFLDAAWQFAVRFASLSHERLVRQRLAKRGWVLMDLEQDRAHRPDFLAYRNEAWLMVAARVLPGNLDGTRKRLNQTPPPFDAVPVIAIPDKEEFHSGREVFPSQGLSAHSVNRVRGRPLTVPVASAGRSCRTGQRRAACRPGSASAPRGSRSWPASGHGPTARGAPAVTPIRQLMIRHSSAARPT
jgi:hypothetical protein